jgi:hypothetical protein
VVPSIDKALVICWPTIHTVRKVWNPRIDSWGHRVGEREIGETPIQRLLQEALHVPGHPPSLLTGGTEAQGVTEYKTPSTQLCG